MVKRVKVPSYYRKVKGKKQKVKAFMRKGVPKSKSKKASTVTFKVKVLRDPAGRILGTKWILAKKKKK